ncbi:MAG: metalloregulator ArsR/SmtB family transcription factor [Gemmatimonadales bacterium]|nr:metalloregulator ArsR/SmtB family transcription factor [Gemmatimonadales bacterium]
MAEAASTPASGNILVTSLDPVPRPAIFVPANMTTLSSATELLVTVAEPTRLRILNCLAAAPLFVSDLQEVLALPQPTVSRHLTVLKKAELVRDTSVAPFVLYRLCRDPGPQGRLVKAILESLGTETEFRRERTLALERSRKRGGSEAKR